MTTAHAPDTQHKTGYWWFMMAVMGVLSLTFNLWMVIAPPPGVSAGEATRNMLLGIIVHGSPVLLSALVSHGFKTPLLGDVEKKIIIVLFLGFMGMSISTQATLLMAGNYLHWTWAWFLPLAIDTIALLSLRAILTAHRLNKEAVIARDKAAERAAVARDITPAIREDIRREFEGQLPALRTDITAAVWRDIWRAAGRDIPAGFGVDIGRHMAALTAAVEEDVLAQREEEFADAERARDERWQVERIDLEENIRQEEREAALARWKAAETELAKRIEFQVRRELQSGSGGKRPAIAAAASDVRLTADQAKEIVRQALLSDEKLTNAKLAEMIGRDTKTVIRYKKALRAEMGLADDDGDGDTPHLRAV